MMTPHHVLLASALLAPVLIGQDRGTETPIQEAADTVPIEDTDEVSDVIAKGNSLDEQEQEYFATCDYDENGWISYREAESSLHLNRDGFGQYDSNNDGQVTREEFHDRYRELLKRIGAFRKPTPEGVEQIEVGSTGLETGLESIIPSSSQAFVGAYDTNVDGKLGTAELQAAAAGLGFGGASPEAILAKLDTNRSKFVEPAELQDLLDALNLIEGSSLIPLGAKANSIEELFGGTEERPYAPGVTPRPPLIKGPVPPFRRLDLNNDGFIEVLDLEQLSVSAHTVVRPSAILAGLDIDGDGKLGPAELKAAFDG